MASIKHFQTLIHCALDIISFGLEDLTSPVENAPRIPYLQCRCMCPPRGGGEKEGSIKEMKKVEVDFQYSNVTNKERIEVNICLIQERSDSCFSMALSLTRDHYVTIILPNIDFFLSLDSTHSNTLSVMLIANEILLE